MTRSDTPAPAIVVAGDALVDLTPATTTTGDDGVRASPRRVVPQRRRRPRTAGGTHGIPRAGLERPFGRLMRAT